MSTTANTNPTGGIDTYHQIDEQPTDRELEYDEIDYPDPITHGVGVQAVVNDLEHPRDSIYRRMFEYWQNYVGDRDLEPHILAERADRHLEWLDQPAALAFKSKGYMLGKRANDGHLNGQFYEYSLQLLPLNDDGSPNPDGRLTTSCQTWIRPENESLVYKSGDNYQAQYGEGSKLWTQTTYAEPGEAVCRSLQIVRLALRAMFGDDNPRSLPSWRDPDHGIERDSLRVWKGEVHHRIDKDLMRVTCETIADARRLIAYGGGSEAHEGHTEQGLRVEEFVRSERWDLLGFDVPDGFELGMKCYRLRNWQSVTDDRLKHPKIETFIAGRDDDTKILHLSEWREMRDALERLCSAMCVRSGVSLADLRKDDLYEAQDRERHDMDVPINWRQVLETERLDRERTILQRCYSSLTASRWDLLYAIVVQGEGGATYDYLEETTGLARSTIREYVREFNDEDVLKRLTWPVVVVFWNEELRINARERLQQIRPDDDLRDVRARAEDRREQRRQRREERGQFADRDDETALSDDSARSNDDDLPGTPVEELADDRDSASTTTDDDSARDERRDDELHDTVDTDTDRASWRYFSDIDLTPDQLGRALDQEYIDHDHVRVRTDPYPLFAD